MKPKIKIINTDDLNEKQKETLEKTFDQVAFKKYFENGSKGELNTMVGEAFKDVFKSKEFKDMPEELQLILKRNFTGNAPAEKRPDLAVASHDVLDVLLKHKVTHYEAYGVLEAVKHRISFKAHCNKVRD